LKKHGRFDVGFSCNPPLISICDFRCNTPLFSLSQQLLFVPNAVNQSISGPRASSWTYFTLPLVTIETGFVQNPTALSSQDDKYRSINMQILS
jgi:hypothetical protein